MAERSLDERLVDLLTRVVTNLHEEAINLGQASRESRARCDRQDQEARARHLAEERRAESILERVEAEVAEEQKKCDELDRKAQERARRRSQWAQEKQKVARELEKKNAALKRKNDKRTRAAESIKACLARIGVSFAKVDEREDETYIGVEGLGYSDPSTSSDSSTTFYLCFSQLGALDKFIVLRAEPTFPEFEELARETNESQDLIKLLLKSRRCWTRDFVK